MQRTGQQFNAVIKSMELNALLLAVNVMELAAKMLLLEDDEADNELDN